MSYLTGARYVHPAKQRVWQELDYRSDICRVTKGGHIEHLQGRTETWSVSPSVDMLPFGVTIPPTVPQRSEIPEGLVNYPVFVITPDDDYNDFSRNM